MGYWKKLFGFDRDRGGRAVSWAEEARALLPSYHNDGIPSAIDPVEVTKVALRLRVLIEATVPCELEEDLVTQAHSRVVTHKVVQAAREAGGDEFKACVVYALLVNKRWFARQAKLEIWDADLYHVRATAAEVIAKQILETEEDMQYLLGEVLLKRYATMIEGEPTNVANVIERAVDLHALRVIGSSSYQKCVQYLWKGWLVQDDIDPTRFVEYEEKGNTRFWVHLDPDRMRAPVYQNATRVVFSLFYLALYTQVINSINPTGELDVFEIFLYIFTFGFVADEIGKIWKVGRYYIGFWNCFNVILYGLLTTSLVLRCFALNYKQGDEHRAEYNELSYNFLAFSAPMFWMRLLLFMDTFQFFGAMLVVLKIMFQESLIFFALLFVVILGFAQAFIGMDSADNHTDATFFIIQSMANAVMQSPDFEGWEGFAHPFGLILYYLFTFVVMVILLNILIALYNSAYEDISGNALDEYMALFAQKTMQFVRAPDENVFIPPLNLVEIFLLILPFEWWLPEAYYRRLNDIVMAILYAPLLVVAAFVEVRTAKKVQRNRKRNELDDDTIEEWEEMVDEVDFEGEGWLEKVERAKPDVENDQATIAVMALEKEVGELKALLKKVLEKIDDGKVSS